MGETQQRDKNNFLVNIEEYIRIYLEKTLDSPAPSLILSLSDHTVLILILSESLCIWFQPSFPILLRPHLNLGHGKEA